MSPRSLVMAGGIVVALGLIVFIIGPHLVNTEAAPKPGATTPATSRTPSPGARSSLTAGGSSTDPVVFGSTVFAVWSDRDQSYDAWWGRLKPFLDEAAVPAYQGTDPAQIPDVRVDGRLSVDKEPPDLPGLSAMVHVPTTGGSFGLFLVRVDEHSPWRLLRINFPAQDNGPANSPSPTTAGAANSSKGASA